jgi:bidirectional [NiFe] hydrogenase diaphorase subunit
LGTTPSEDPTVTDARTRRGEARAESAPARRSEDAHPSGDDRFLVIDKHLKRARYAQDQLIETLHVAQDVFGYLDEGILVYVARALRLPPSMVYGVATFYQLFTFDPPGDHSCTVCTGTACFVKGAPDIVALVGEEYGIAAGDTTEDGVLTLKTARCLGSCGLAPVVLLDGAVHGREGPEAVAEQVRRLLEREPAAVAEGGES